MNELWIGLGNFWICPIQALELSLTQLPMDCLLHVLVLRDGGVVLALDQSIASNQFSENFEISTIEIKPQFPLVVCIVCVPSGACFSYIIQWRRR